MKLFCLFLITCLAIVVNVIPAQAQTVPVVKIAYFFDPDCGNCHLVATRDLPPLKSRYGDQLVILEIDITKSEGIQLYREMARYFQLSKDRMGTPTIIIGKVVLVGAAEIPDKLPGLIEESLSKGGIDWPEIPGIPAYIANLEKSNTYPEPVSPVYPQPVIQNENDDQSENISIWDRFGTNFKKDVTANSLAVIILVFMLVSFVVILTILIRYILSDNPSQVVVKIPGWVIPLLIVIGLGIAAYLTFVEVGRKPAVCGPVGHCNEVQNSPYAKLFGILPVGVLGLLGYTGIMIAWCINQIGPQRLRNLCTMAIWGMSLFGVAFSIYLTFLEPFVIGAACIWCLSSAMVMTALLWVATPGLLEMLAFEDDDEDDHQELTSETVNI